ncbi:MAG: hypothetical protein E4H03_08460, partial [Myxococcales bacterium]
MAPHRIVTLVVALALVLSGTHAGAQVACTATVMLDEPVTWLTLSLQVGYTQPAIEFDGSGAGVLCTNRATGVSTFNDDDAGLLTAELTAAGASTGPEALFDCSFTAITEPAPGDFAAAVVEAIDPLLQSIAPLPSVALS